MVYWTAVKAERQWWTSESRAANPGTKSTMTVSKSSRSRLEVIPLEEFLRSPPAGFSVEKIGGSDLLVSSDPESSLVLIDDIDGRSERVLFQNSLGR